jgi:hypothetical protein
MVRLTGAFLHFFCTLNISCLADIPNNSSENLVTRQKSDNTNDGQPDQLQDIDIWKQSQAQVGNNSLYKCAWYKRTNKRNIIQLNVVEHVHVNLESQKSVTEHTIKPSAIKQNSLVWNKLYFGFFGLQTIILIPSFSYLSDPSPYRWCISYRGTWFNDKLSLHYQPTGLTETLHGDLRSAENSLLTTALKKSLSVLWTL